MRLDRYDYIGRSEKVALGWTASHVPFQEHCLVKAQVLWEVFSSALGYPASFFRFICKSAVSILRYQPTDIFNEI